MLSVCKMNCVSVPTLILSYRIQNTVDVILIANSKYQKWKDNLKNHVYYYRYHDWCIDNEKAAV